LSAERATARGGAQRRSLRLVLARNKQRKGEAFVSGRKVRPMLKRIEEKEEGT